jgi:K+-sensing histidine kinase KdpD
LFRPFSKSALDAARSAPGVGLGLALSRRLARALGGDLRLQHDGPDGVCFVLTLPIELRRPGHEARPSHVVSSDLSRAEQAYSRASDLDC